MKKYILLSLFAQFTLINFYATSLKAQPGIGHIQVAFQDAARNNRSIQTEIYYPSAIGGNNAAIDAGMFPVIVFGHGFVMAWSAYDNIWQDLVAQGYIVAFPTTEGGLSPNHLEFGRDLSFVIAKMKTEGANNQQSLFYNHIASTSAVMGHSMGGGSAFLAAENNNNITTIVTFAAAVTNPSSVTAAQNINIPALVISGSNDCVAPPLSNQQKMYDSLATACKFYVEIKGAGHCYFANNNFNCSFGEGTCVPNPTITRSQQQRASSDFMAMWLNYYLKNDCISWDAFNDSLNLSPRIIHNQVCNILNPTISFSNNNLQSTPARSYQWYLNGVLINGATTQFYTPQQAGNYIVKVTYYNTCEYFSNTINWTGLKSISNFQNVLVFPNPASNVLNVSLQLLNASSVSIAIFNNLNQKVLVYDFKGILGESSKSIDIVSLSPGMYYLDLIVNQEQSRHTFIKN